MFIHLHNHTHYSILEWLPKPKDYVKKAVELWMNAVTITDTSNIHGCHELYKEAKEAWIKAILWTEIFVESSLDSNLNHKLVLLAKSLNWFRNIIFLVSKANLDNPWKIPKIKLEDILELKNSKKNLDIVCLSWPISWEIPYYILTWKSDEKIIKKIDEYKEIFWEENYFLELMYHDDIPKQNFITDKLIELKEKYNLQVVATNNCYYIEKNDKKTQDVIKALWTWHEIENPDRPTLINWDYSFLSEEEMQSLFGFIPEALSNTEKIAKMVDIKIKTGWILIPKFTLPERHQIIFEEAKKIEENEKDIQKLDSSEWYLRYLSFKWMNWRFWYEFSNEEIFEFIKKLDKWGLKKDLQETSPEELKELSITYYTDKKKQIINSLNEEQKNYIDRLEYELVVINEMWFNWYFLIVADYIYWARKNNIPVWPWRWSAAWSLMAYLSWITDLNPLEYNLLFERFLNPARVSMPDIDTDFADDERDKVVEYCRNKYWNWHVAQICTFWTFAARAAVKDVWRVFWIPFTEMNELVKLIPEKAWTKLKQALEESPDFLQMYNSNEKYKEIIDNALKIEWNVRQLWVHACAVIIAPEPMIKFTALWHPPKDSETIVTQYSAYPLEDLGLLKMDFLWLRNLSIIKRALRIIKNNSWDEFDILKLNMTDQKVFKIFANWDTTWVFQFESDWMRKYLSDLKPNCFEDIIVMVSLYRPWPIQYIPTYINRKHWKEKVEYAHPSLEKILSPTQWIAVYQEQIMEMVQAFAGFSLWEADILRRAIWKKKITLLMEQKKKFIDAASLLWHPEDLSKHIFEDVIEPFAWYWFNKSHAACYAFIAYQTAFLKAYYQTEFLTSIMVSDEDNMERIVMEVEECEKKWISILPPSVWQSLKHFTFIDKKNIRFWLKAIKWIWDWPINKIIETRERLWWKFENLEQFIEECGKEVINKKSLEALILSWAMDEFWNRKQMFENIPELIRFCRKDENKKETSQIWLFDNSEVFKEKLELSKSEEFSFEEKLIWEKSMIGFYISGHPLDWLKKYCTKRSNNTKYLKLSIDELKEINEKKKIKEETVQTVWIITDFRKIYTKNWKQMIFIKCEWFDFDFEVVVFAKEIEKYKNKIELDKIIIVSWILSINFEYWRKSINARDIKVVSITTLRKQADDLWLFDNSKRQKQKIEKPAFDIPKNNITENKEEDDIEEKDEVCEEGCEILPENFEEILDEKIEENKIEKDEKISEKYLINIPSIAKKEDLHELKSFLQKEKPWFIKIFLNLNNTEIDTKIQIENLENLKKWIEQKWNISE